MTWMTYMLCLGAGIVGLHNFSEYDNSLKEPSGLPLLAWVILMGFIVYHYAPWLFYY